MKSEAETPAEIPSEVRFFIWGEKCQEKGNFLRAAACFERALDLNYQIADPSDADVGMAHDIRCRLGQEIYPELEAECRESDDEVSAEYFRRRAAMYHSPVEEGSVSWGELIDLDTGEVIG